MSTHTFSLWRPASAGLLVAAIGIAAALSASSLPAQGSGKRIALIAGRASHPAGFHEFRAGSMLLQKSLAGVPGVQVDVYANGWPTQTVDGATVDDNAPLERADAIFIYADGGNGHPINRPERLTLLEKQVARGAGIGFGHYGVEVPVGPSADALLRWIGGYYETRYSVNPMWAPPFEPLRSHAVTRGVGAFTNHDEWYFSMRWTQDAAMTSRVTPILVAKPSDDVRDGPYVNPAGPYPHIVAGSGNTETMMWLAERADGGRGLGFTGGHTHTHWGDVNQRRLVANALLWLAKVEVPAGGVQDQITAADLTLNLDIKPPRK